MMLSVFLAGITFSFFWKNHETASRFAIASGGKVISNGFSVFANAYGGYVDFYTRGNSKRWKANINIPGIGGETRRERELPPTLFFSTFFITDS